MRHSASHTERAWMGRSLVASAPAAEEDRTARAVVVAPDPDEDRTAVEDARTHVAGETDHAVLTADMLAELRRRLREAEEREASGVRLRPGPDDDDDLELDIEVEAPALHAIEAITPLPAIEVALAPNSESNFYAGFDEAHPTGVFVATYSRLPVGAPVYLDVHLPAGFRFRTAALVEWVRPPEAAGPGAPAGIGFEMRGLDEVARRLVHGFARNRKPLFYVA